MTDANTINRTTPTRELPEQVPVTSSNAGLIQSNRNEYNSWKSMRNRCSRPSNASWKYYGAKGIKVCDRWVNSFANFLADMGPRPSLRHTLDRIDCNGNYDPSNCRWSDLKTQARNRPSINRLITHDGKTLCVAEWEQVTGISGRTIVSRIDDFGWSVEQALTIKPVMGKQPLLAERRANGPMRISSDGCGVSFHKPQKRWQASIRINGKVHYLGHHETRDAALAVVAAKRREVQEAVSVS